MTWEKNVFRCLLYRCFFKKTQTFKCFKLGHYLAVYHHPELKKLKVVLGHLSILSRTGLLKSVSIFNEWFGVFVVVLVVLEFSCFFFFLKHMPISRLSANSWEENSSNA